MARRRPLQAQLAVRAQPYELQHGVVGLSVDQHQVGPNVTVAVVFPLAPKGMGTVPLGERLIDHELTQDGQGSRRPACAGVAL